MKVCYTCKESLDESRFYIRREGNKQSFRSSCKACIYQSRKNYNAANKTKILKDAARARARNRGNTMLWIARNRAKRLGLEFDLTLSDIIIPEFCPVFGIALHFQSGKAADCSPSLDRIDSKRGYVKGNVRVISNRANLLKNNANLYEIIMLYEYMIKGVNL